MTRPDAVTASFDQIVDAIRARHASCCLSHARPDGDSIGSQLAMAYALRALGKEVTIVNKDAAPPPLMAFPGVPAIQIADHVTGDFDAAIIMECGDLRANRRDRARALLRDQHRPSSRQHRLRRRSTGSTRRRPPAARWCST